MRKVILAAVALLGGCGDGDTSIQVEDRRQCVVNSAFNSNCEELLPTSGEGEANQPIECRPNENNTGDQSVAICSTTTALEFAAGEEGKLGDFIATGEWFADEASDFSELPDS